MVPLVRGTSMRMASSATVDAVVAVGTGRASGIKAAGLVFCSVRDALIHSRTMLALRPCSSATLATETPGAWQAAITFALNSGECRRRRRGGTLRSSIVSVHVNFSGHYPGRRPGDSRWVYRTVTLQPRKRTGGQCALLNLKRRNPPPAFGWMTVGLHGPVFLRKHTVLSMARHIQVNRDWCPVIVPLVGPAQHCCQVIRNTHRWKQHYARPELPTETLVQTQP